MILLDANLLIYAFDIGSPQHSASRDWLDGQLRGLSSVGFPWETITAFLRVVTNPRIYQQPSTMAAAWQTDRQLAHRRTELDSCGDAASS